MGPVTVAEGIELGKGNTGVGVFTDPLYIVLGLALAIIIFLVIKNWDEILNFIFKK